MFKKKKQRLKGYQNTIAKLIKVKSLNLVTNILTK